MAEVAANQSDHQQYESKNISCKEMESEVVNSHSQWGNIECGETEESTENMSKTELLKKGFMDYGCMHYRRRCRIRAPCCNKIFDCRHCHNEAMNSISVDQKLRHDIPRHQVKQVICSLCGTEQQVQQVCVNCGVCMAEYFCETCKLFDEDVGTLSHLRSSTIAMAVGFAGSVDVRISSIALSVVSYTFSHHSLLILLKLGAFSSYNKTFCCFCCCDKGCCYSILLKNSHPCIEGAMHHDCPVCCEYLFESRNDVTVMLCGHTIHKNCLKDMWEHYHYACPLCLKSVSDMSKVWEKYDMEIAATPMPEAFSNKMVSLTSSLSLSHIRIYVHVGFL
ncbi:hypothetical protein EZV62_013433 [Acer yangbiense]|uniref:RING-type domain-containing protein n=1 Tax=Acer yangbiense TaxID=1000413 RepID=A0A5C7HYP5_9ROSI|nr:hypothetical protein EZV62_013433 [Acer yangbiense]